LRIRLYGRLGDALGAETQVEAPAGCTVADVRRLLGAGHSTATEALARSRACVGDRMVGDDQRLSGEDVIEFLPPVSGG
jgi:molybdopterin converting factor small subunit